MLRKNLDRLKKSPFGIPLPNELKRRSLIQLSYIISRMHMTVSLFKYSHQIYSSLSFDEKSSVSISSDSKYIVSGSRDCSIKIIDVENKKELYHFKYAHQGKLIQILSSNLLISFIRWNILCEYLKW